MVVWEELPVIYQKRTGKLLVRWICRAESCFLLSHHMQLFLSTAFPSPLTILTLPAVGRANMSQK